MYKNVSIHHIKNLPLYSFHLSFGFRGGKIEKERTRSFSIHEDFDVFSVKKNTTQIHKRNFIFVHICLDQPIRTKNLALYREILFQIFFTFFPTIFPPRNPSPNHTQHFPVLSALYFNTPSSSPLS